MTHSKFKMPMKSDLKGRSSTISNAFAISITPYIHPSNAEVDDMYRKLELQEGQCAYCLGDGNGRDHIRPLVRNGMPTGYITDIHNLVPCCQACNSSKGAKEFRTWYLSGENISRLKNRGLSDEQIEHRYKVVVEYEKGVGSPLDYEQIVGKELWEEYKSRRRDMIEKLSEDQKFCDMLYEMIIEKTYRSSDG